MPQKIVYHEYGNSVDVLKLESGPEPAAPGPGQLLVRVTKRPIHNGDLLMVNGGHDPVRKKIPAAGFSTGYEGLGRVEAVGPNVDEARGIKIGDRVSFIAVGSWQEVLLVLADHVAVVPQDLEDELAAQLFINPVAAMMLTRMVFAIAANPQAGTLRISAVEDVVEDLAAANAEEAGVVLLSVAGSTVARLAASILKGKGFTPIGLVRSTASAATLQETTGIAVIAHDQEGWQDEVREAAAGRRIFAALDAVGGKIGEAVLGVLSPAGTLVSYGSLTGEPIPVDHVHLCMTNKKVCGVGMVHWTQLPYATRAADITTLIDMVREHRNVFRIAGDFPLSQVADAIRLFRTPGRDGTVLLSN